MEWPFLIFSGSLSQIHAHLYLAFKRDLLIPNPVTLNILGGK